ncbi:MAG: F0F1 ATP synthase subunit alpha [Lachnospiraceae bacterium]|nr:F0F1 ATP synthase subunit alpha [Lachnospiraceae bacterium]
MMNEKKLRATLRYVMPPSTAQAGRFREFIASKYDTPIEDIDLELKHDADLVGGFILQVNEDEYDWSFKGRARQIRRETARSLAAGAGGDIISVIKNAADAHVFTAEGYETGNVVYCGDGIARIKGLSHVEYGEIVIFESGVRGMVLDIREDHIGCILLCSDDEVCQGEKAVRTGRAAGVPVGDALLGRVVNSLGDAIDGLDPIDTDEHLPVESPAPGIVDRQPVSTPMETGILAIDSMFPIGRGQRELIIGDRQTGKTTIATDTIINQKGKDVICIYVSIGQKASTVAALAQNLRRHGAMDYSIIVGSFASDPAPLQYLAPYSATAIAEYFMHKGGDVLIVYDDLSKHAVAYREISLLLRRPPGREAYPGDVFYLHSRLLERSSRLSDELGGGSITALQIIETQAGDVSAYIPTNVISITDGQIFLESDLFAEGQRPAVNVGLSVSRVGGAAQTKAMKKATGSFRIDLAQFREMEVFTQFSADLDDATQAQLTNGKALMEVLKQPGGTPMSMCEQVITLVAAGKKVFSGVKPAEIKDFQQGLIDHFYKEHKEIVEEIESSKTLSDELAKKMTEISETFKRRWLKTDTVA